MTIYICDRCRKEYDSMSLVRFSINAGPKKYFYLDLCQLCNTKTADEVMDFTKKLMKGGE